MTLTITRRPDDTSQGKAIQLWNATVDAPLVWAVITGFTR